MVAARTAAKGLSTVDLEQIRDTLAAGRKPKVVFTEQAGQIAGQLGQVVALTDPELSDEWVVVRFGRDELPFSPADLAIAPKTTAAKRGAAAVPAPREESSVPAASVADSPAAVTSAAAPDSPADAAAASSSSPAPDAGGGSDVGSAPGSDPAGSGSAAAAGSGSGGAGSASAGSAAGSGGDSSDSSGSGESRPSSSKPPAKKTAPKAKPPAGLTVTLAYADGEWTVAANQGAKALAKPYVIKAGEALKMVAMLDVPGVHEAVEEIVSAARAEAENQAERLRAELAEIEARLAELREAE
ncbi:hypothetical protein Dvina_27495 [Dactylosporangium vinaceum]|uniref:Uncharacterized protein n=1 Tax=Dactylosporangium vinaceum TaxID=53362 RepID=A0ABV5MCB6_9ACTN|nr:hypothetical protein [Dactylosporangium vinaceum]UAB92134.1 hypothetical protein Dvina_27495 [Dactylosporangium vinaceum]